MRRILSTMVGHETLCTLVAKEWKITKSFPFPDFIIRTGGEKRLSNFYLWQSSYSELYFSDKLWPDFDKKDFEIALEDFSSRKRKFGVETG